MNLQAMADFKRRLDEARPRFLADVAAGKSMRDIAAERTMSHEIRKTLLGELTPAERAQVALNGRKTTARKLREGAATAETCRKGHPRTERNTRVFTWRGRTFRECRVCRMLLQRTAPPVLEQVVKACELIRGGETIAKITKHRKGVGRVIGFYQLKQALDADVDLGREMRGLSHRNASLARRSIIVPPQQARQHEANDFHRVMAMLPNHLPADIRRDIVSDIFEAILAGRMRMENVRANIPGYVTAYNRRYSHYVPVHGGVMQSLDAPIFADGAMKVGDQVSRGLWQ